MFVQNKPNRITVINEKGSCLSPKLTRTRRETKLPTEIDQMMQEMEESRNEDEINELKYKVENGSELHTDQGKLTEV